MATPSPYSNTGNLASIFPTDCFAAVTPHNSNTLTYNGVADSMCKGLYIGSVAGGGDIVVVNSAGQNVTFTVAAGTILPVRATRVLATGTTASAIIAFF